MIGIIVTGHGTFANGITSALQLIAGAQDNYKEITFEDGKNPDTLAEELQQAITELNTDQGVLVFTDLKGGTPHKESVVLSMSNENVHVFAGTNIAMLLEASLMRLAEPEIAQFAKDLLETGISQVDLFDPASLKAAQNNDEDEDGI